MSVESPKQMSLSIQLVHVFDIRIDFHQRLSFEPMPGGSRQAYTSVKSGQVYGPQLNGKVLDYSGADWPIVRTDGVVELNFLDAKRDQVDTEGVPDPDTGGQTLYVTPRVGVNIVRGLVARAAVQIPVWENLNGIQDVKPAFTAGLTYVF